MSPIICGYALHGLDVASWKDFIGKTTDINWTAGFLLSTDNIWNSPASAHHGNSLPLMSFVFKNDEQSVTGVAFY